MVTRRHLLIAGGASIVVLASGTATFALTREPTAALAPWREASNRFDDPRLNALTYAILSPNPHNRQPWLVRLHVGQEMSLYCDLDRRLPETDPDDRQITIGLGCFVESARLAANADGYEIEITPFPDGMPSGRLDDRAVAHMRLVQSPEARPDPLFAHFLDRRSNKEPFDTSQQVTPEAISVLQQATLSTPVYGAVDEPHVATLRDLTWRAHIIETETPRTFQESIDLMRFGKAQILANPDGIDLGGPFLEALYQVGLLTPETIADPSSSAYAQGLDMYREIIGTAMGHLWMVTEGNSKTDQIAAGRDWLRINLAATAAGLGIHPLSQSLQEYPEMAPLLSEVHEVLGVPAPNRIQMLARVGYGESVPPSPRWPMESRVVGV